jgi:hypothetical protein
MKSFWNLLETVSRVEGVSGKVFQIAIQCLILFLISNFTFLVFSIAKAKGYVSFDINKIRSAIIISFIFSILFFTFAYLMY